MTNKAYKKNTPDSSENTGSDQRKDFESFFRLFYTDLCKYTYRFTNNREISKDIVQSVFLKVWEQKDFWDDFDSAKSYLYKSVRNEALNYKKHVEVERKTRSEVRQRIKQWKETSRPDDNEKRMDLVREGINTLPDKCQEIFKLSRDSGLTYNEIAEVLGLSVKTVETQMGRAFKKLRSYVKVHQSKIILLLAFLLSS
ncbi:RNA polymerase sigma-70 factor [Halalkalibaculum sp. DA3122]|uniref:RNA polymerase sigma-70 factor n=1 Tax=Halalkalibaculum sp. DA3122 TaxID=3373607 RepID=UPI0037541F86